MSNITSVEVTEHLLGLFCYFNARKSYTGEKTLICFPILGNY